MKIAYLPTEFYKPPLSEVEKGVEAFKAETKALGAGGLALAAQGLQNIIPDAVEPGLLQKGKEWGLRKSEEIMSAHQADPRMQARIQRVEDIKSATDAKDWALYQGTKGLLNVATMALGGGIGAGLARGAVKEGVKRYAKAEVGKRVGQTLVTKAGQKAAQQQINTAMARGAIAGGAASSFLMEGGESYSSLVNDEGHSSEEAFLPAFTVGVVNAALDVVPGVIAAKYVGKTLKEIKGGLKSQILKDPTLAKKVVHVAKQAAKGAAGGVALEGVTEGLQELVQIAGERWAAETNIFAELSPEQQSRVLNAAAAGGLTGGLLGGVGGTFRGVGEAAMAEQEVPPSPPPPPASPTVEAPAPQGPPGALPAPVLEGEFIEGEQPPPPPPPQAGRQGQTVDPDFAGLPPPQQQLPPPQGQLPPPPGAPPFELTPPEAPPEGPAPVPPAPAEPNPGQMELDLQVPRAPLFERLVPPETETESDPNYFYHATSIENLQDIITSGQLDIFSPDYGTDQSRWPDDGEEPRSYWRPDAASTASFAPEYGKPVVVRAKKTDAFKREGAGDFYRQDVLPAEELEVLTKDGWEPLASQIQRPVEETPTEQPRPELVLTPPEAPMEETPVQEAPVPQLADPQQLELDPQQLSPVQPLNEKTRPEWETWLRNSKLAGEEVLTNKSLDELSKFPSDVAIRFRELIDTYDSGQISKSEYRTKAAALYKEARGTDTKPENTTPAPTENVSLAETDLSTEERTRLGVLSTLERWGDLTDEQRPVLDDLRRRAGPEETAPEVAPVVTKEYSFQPVTSRERLTEVRTKDYKYFATRGSAKAGVTKFLKDNPWYKPEEVVIEPRDEGFVGVLVKQGERLVPTDREILENPKGAPLQKAENILNKLSAMYKVDEGAARRLALDLTDVVMPAPYGTAKRDAQVKKSEEFYEKLVKEKLEPTERRKFLYELLKVASALPEGQRPVDWQSVFTKDLGEEVSNPAFDPIWDRLYDGKLENLDPSGMELKAGSLAVMAKVSPMDVLRDMQTRVRKLVSGVDWLKFDSLPPAQRERLLPYRSIYQKVDAMGVLASLRQALQEDAATAQPATDILDRSMGSTYNPVTAGIAPRAPAAPPAPPAPVQAPTNKTPLDVLAESYGLDYKVAQGLGFTEEELRAKAPAGGAPFRIEGGTVRLEYVLNKLRENGFDVQSPEDIVRLVRGQLNPQTTTPDVGQAPGVGTPGATTLRNQTLEQLETAPASEPKTEGLLQEQAKALYLDGHITESRYRDVRDALLRKEYGRVEKYLDEIDGIAAVGGDARNAQVALSSSRKTAQMRVDLRRMLALNSQAAYEGGYVQTSIKETLQNSFDAVKKIAKKLGGTGRITVRLDRTARTVSIEDNGVGMSQKEVHDYFLTLGGTGKGGVGSSGGMGLAKGQFLTGAEWFELTTTKGGKTTTLRATPDEIIDGDAETITEETSRPSGTVLTLKVPLNYTTSSGEERYITFPYNPENIDVFTKPLLGPVEVALVTEDGEKILPIGKHFDVEKNGTPFLTKVKFSWGTADIYFGKERKEYPSQFVLSDGIFQFHLRLRTPDYETVPYDIIVNVVSAVDTKDSRYPFNNTREAFRSSIQEDEQALRKYLIQIASGLASNEVAETFQNFKQLPRSKSTRGVELTPEEQAKGREVLKEFVKEPPKKKANPLASVPKTVVVGGGKVEGPKGEQLLKNESKEKESMEADPNVLERKGIELEEGMDRSKPVFHNNTSVDYIAVHGEEAAGFFADLGSVVVDFVEVLGEVGGWTYQKFAASEKDSRVFGGVSIDKSYYGVHLKAAFTAIFLNPLHVREAKTLAGLANAMYLTLVHEGAHHNNMGHNEFHTSELHRLFNVLADSGRDIEIKEKLGDTLYKYRNIYRKMRETFNESTTRNVAKPLNETSKHNAAPAQPVLEGRDQRTTETTAGPGPEELRGGDGITLESRPEDGGGVGGNARGARTRTVSRAEFEWVVARELGRNWLRRAINLGLLRINETSAPDAPSGIFDPATGVMTINLDKIPVNENVLGLLLHEAGAHAGLEAMIGPGFVEMVEQVRRLANAGNSVARRAMLKALQEVADRFGVSHELRTLEGDALQAEINRVQGLLGENATAVAHLRQEQLAYYTQFAAQSPDGLFRRVVNAVKAWFMGTEFGKALAAAGLTPQLSDGLMVALAVRAAQQQVRLTEETAHLRADGRVTEGARVFQSAVWHAGPMDHATGLVMESRPDYIDEDGVPVSTIQLVDDQLAKELDAGETITLYRAMALIDGKLYPPMSAKITDESGKLALRSPEPIGKWQQAEERPDLVPTDGRYKGQFPLKKPGGGTTWALYAPYFHASPLPLNDQFTAAYKNDGVDRPQIVTVEVEVPASEMTSGYQARGSVKKVGPNSWNSGVVASKLPGGREVFLSRYLKIKRIVPDAEVAQKIAEIVIPNRLQIPENTVTPQLRVELEKQGVRIAPKGTRGDDIRYSERDPLPTTQIKPAVEPNILESRPGSTPDSPIWFSPLGVAVAGLKQNKAPAAQWRQTILQQNKDGRWTPKLPGVRVEEIEDLGLLEWLDAKQGSVTKEEILRFVEQGGPKLEEVVKTDAEEVVGTDAEQRVRYWLEGGAGRRGPFWTVEEAESWRVDGDELVKELGASVPRHARYQTPGGENYRELLLKLPAARSDNYHSSHWSEPNVVVHIRFNERKDAEGRRVLFVEEVQSDWAQEGKKYGYGLSVQEAKELEELLAWHEEHASFEADMERAERLNEMTEEEAEAFVLSAAEQTRENNLDRIAELKQKKQHATPLTPFKSTSSWAMLGMKRAIRWAVDNGFDQVAWTTGETQVQRYPENPPNGPWQKGMEGFYDQILPAEVNKFLRKHRVKVRLGEVQPGQTAWTLDIPPSLREEAQGGMPLYSIWDFVKDPAKAVFGAVGHNVNNLSRYEKFRSYIQDRFFLMKEHQRKEYFAVLNGVKLKALGRGREDALSALNDPANNFPPGAKVEFLPSETPLPESQMVHETFEEAPKRKADRRQQMKERYLDPMLRLAGKYGITLDELDALAYARHAPEANERLRRVTAKSWFNEMLGEMSGAHRAEFLKKKKAMLAATQGDRKARQRGYLELIEGTAAQGYQDGAKYKASSKTLLRWNAFYEKPSGMSEQESQELLQQFDPAHVDEIFTLFDEMNRSVVAQLVAGGVLTQEQAARWTGAYKHYATLHRASYEHEGTSHGGGMSVGKAARVRHGSAEIAVDVFTSTVESMERAMNLIENNRVMNVLKNFLDANPDPTFMDVVRKDQVHYLDKEGSVVVGSAKGRGQHEAVGFKDGKMFIIRAKNNEKARAVIAALNNIDGPRLGPIMSSFMTVTKFMSAMSTSWSPEFFFVNAPRDFLESLYNVQDADGAKVWKEMVSGYAKSARALHRVFRARSNGKPIPQGEWEQWVRAFEQNGGPTGWMDVFESTEKHRNALETRMKELHPKANFHKGLRSVIDWVEDYNAIAENVIRLSLFKALVGDLNNPKIPIRRATSIAKNLTVNFNRRGTAGPALNALYMFANAGIQGSVRIIGALKNSSTVRKMVVATVVMSMIVDQINRAMDDDEEYDKIPAHIKERNLVFMNPFGGHAVLIPAPWGYNVFWRMGQVISEGIEASQGNMRGWTPGGAALDMTSVIFNAFMPIHGPTLAQTLTPSPLRPLTQIVENKDAFGQKLKPEPFPGQVIPETQQYWSNASAASKMLTELLGRGTGGDDVTSGLIDISPAWTDAIAKELTGAVGRQILTLTSLPFKAAAGEAEVRDMPVLRKFVAFPSDAQETAMYHDRVAQVLDAERRLAAYMEGPRRDVERAQELRREAAPLLQMGPQVKDVERQLKSLRTRLKAAEARGDQMQVETIKEKMELVRQRFNQKWEQRVM